MRKTDYLYIEDCYTFAKTKGLVDSMNQIKEKQFEWTRSYDTSVKRGYFLRLFQQNQCLDEFLEIHWPYGRTSRGQHKVTKLMTLAYEYDEYQSQNETKSIYSTEKLQFELAEAIKASILDSSEDRQNRLKYAPKKPEKVQAITTVFKRNPDVIVEVLLRANGVCERCNSPAPFLKRKDKTPYLEVHHVIKLADGGADTVDNAQAVCPNCHRELHFGISK